MEGCQPLLLVVMDLAYQDQGVAHQNAGQRNQPDEGIDAKRLVEEQQRWHHPNQPQRRGEEDHHHRRHRPHLQDDNQQRHGNHDREQRHHRFGGFPGLFDRTRLLDAVSVRQRIDDRLQRLRDGGRNIRRLQIFGYISPDSYGRYTIATAHNRLFHLHLNLANLRQRNALPGSPHQGKAGNFCRVKPDIPRRASHDLYRTDIFPYRGDRNP